MAEARQAPWRAARRRRSARGRRGAHAGRGSTRARPDRPAIRRRRAGPALRLSGIVSAAPAPRAAPRRSPAISRASAAPGRAIRATPAAASSAWAIAAATCRGHSPAVSGQTGSIAGCAPAWSTGTTCSGCAIVSRPLNTSSLPDTSSWAPGGICASRVNLKNTSSATPVPSRTTTRQGWREVAGRSCRTTSTARVATVPGLAPARSSARALRSRYDSGRWNSRSITRSPPAARCDQGARRSGLCRADWSAARTAVQADRDARADMFMWRRYMTARR